MASIARLGTLGFKSALPALQSTRWGLQGAKAGGPTTGSRRSRRPWGGCLSPIASPSGRRRTGSASPVARLQLPGCSWPALLHAGPASLSPAGCPCSLPLRPQVSLSADPGGPGRRAFPVETDHSPALPASRPPAFLWVSWAGPAGPLAIVCLRPDAGDWARPVQPRPGRLPSPAAPQT